VPEVLRACILRGQDLIAERKDSFEEISPLLKERGAITADQLEGLFGFEEFSGLYDVSKNGSVTLYEA
jgi:hypothetical protein